MMKGGKSCVATLQQMAPMGVKCTQDRSKQEIIRDSTEIIHDSTVPRALQTRCMSRRHAFLLGLPSKVKAVG
jgi:hypothetical protein